MFIPCLASLGLKHDFTEAFAYQMLMEFYSWFSRFLSQWRVADGFNWKRNSFYRYRRRRVRSGLHSRSGAESETHLWPRCQRTQILHIVWSSRRLRTILRVKHYFIFILFICMYPFQSHFQLKEYESANDLLVYSGSTDF